MAGGTLNIEDCFKGLADRTRLRIMNLLFHGELCGCDIQYVLKSSQSNVSRHLNYLKRAGLVIDRRDGYRVFYRMAQEDAGFGMLLAYLRTVFQADKAFAQDSRQLREAVRDGACTLSEVTVILPARSPARRTGKAL